jgi:hypothetical protein
MCALASPAAAHPHDNRHGLDMAQWQWHDDDHGISRFRRLRTRRPPRPRISPTAHVLMGRHGCLLTFFSKTRPFTPTFQAFSNEAYSNGCPLARPSGGSPRHVGGRAPSRVHIWVSPIFSYRLFLGSLPACVSLRGLVLGVLYCLLFWALYVLCVLT